MMLDEALYFSVSSSLFGTGEVLLRGQPVVYEYILYPLLLAPLHLLPASFNIFRAIQLFNALLLSSAAIPAYLIGEKITGSRLKGLFTGFFVLCMPDMLMVQHIMAESVVYPLTLWLFYCFLRALEDGGLKSAAACGALAFLLHAAKPGPVIIGAVIAAVLLVLAAARRSRGRLWQFLCGAGVFLALFAAYKLFLHGALGMDALAAGYYSGQLPPLTWGNIANAMNGLLVYALYVPAAFMVLPLLWPLAAQKRLQGEKRVWFLGVMASLVLFIIAIVWAVYIGEMTADPFVTRIHTRYLAMYLPVLLSLCLADDMPRVKVKPWLVACFTGLAAGWLLLAGRASVSGVVFSVDAHLLAAFLIEAPLNGRVWMPMVWMVATSYFLCRMAAKKPGKKGMAAFFALLMLVMLASNAAAYRLDSHNRDALIAQDARQARALAGGDALYLTGSGQQFWEVSMAIDMAYRGTAPIATLEDAIAGTGMCGVLHRFTPQKHEQALSAPLVEPAPAIIVKDELLNQIVTDPAAMVEYTTNGTYAVITPAPGRGWLHSALHGFIAGRVQNESRFTLYDAGALSCEKVRLQLYAKADAGTATLVLACGAQAEEIPLTGTPAWVSVDFAVKDHTRPMTVSISSAGESIYVESYLVQGINA